MAYKTKSAHFPYLYDPREDALYIFKWLKQIKRIVFHDTWKSHKIQCPQKAFYWDTAAIIHLCSVYSCLHTTA